MRIWTSLVAIMVAVWSCCTAEETESPTTPKRREWNPHKQHQYEVTDPGLCMTSGDSSTWAVSKDLKWWASGSLQYWNINVYPFSNVFHRTTFGGFGENVTITGLAFNSAVDRLAAIGQWQSKLKIFDIPKERTLKVLDLPGKQFISMSEYFDHDTKIAVGSLDGKIIIWDVEKEVVFKELDFGTGPVYSLFVGEDGKRIFFNMENAKTIGYFEWETAKDADSYWKFLSTRECENPRGIKQSRNFVACGCLDTSIRVFDLQTRNELAILTAHELPGFSLSFGEKILVSASFDASVCVWDLETFKLVETLPFIVHRYPITNVLTNWDGTRILTFYRHRIREWTRDPGSNVPCILPEPPVEDDYEEEEGETLEDLEAQAEPLADTLLRLQKEMMDRIEKETKGDDEEEHTDQACSASNEASCEAKN